MLYTFYITYIILYINYTSREKEKIYKQTKKSRNDNLDLQLVSEVRMEPVLWNSALNLWGLNLSLGR